MNERKKMHRFQGIVGVGLASFGSLLLFSALGTTDLLRSQRRLYEEDLTDDKMDDLISEDPFMDDIAEEADDASHNIVSTSFFVGLASAFSIKLTSSVDDVVWLVPYLIVPERSKMLTNAAIYLWVCLVQTILALSISHGGIATLDAVNKSKKGWSSEKILTAFAGACLLGYGCKLAHEYYHEVWLGGGDDDDGEGEAEGGADEADGLIDGEKAGYSESATAGTNSSGGGAEAGGRVASGAAPNQSSGGGGSKSNGRKARTSASLFVVAFLGSLDDLTLFVPMLLGQAISWIDLMIGAILAAAAVVVICVCIGKCKPVANCLESVPLAVIVLVFGTYLCIKAATMS
mmetsp:Transcript_14574/g.26768  ORF Transcript_14574/g.26768 Transcript_14574/m.26768 type:complete len:346 (+) Transcript_14574:82-1119(+)